MPPPKCKPNQIVRSAYKTKNGTKVKATCTKDKGKPGKGPKTLPTPEKNNKLRKYGYSLSKPAIERRVSLVIAMKHEPPLKVLKRLILLSNIYATGTMNKRKLKSDVKFLRQFYAGSP